MKTLKFLTITLITLLSLAACEKESDNIFEPDTSINYAEEIAADYIGFYTSKNIDFDDTFELKVARIDNGHIQISGNDFGTIKTDIFANPENPNLLHNDVNRYKDIVIVYDRTTKELLLTLEENEDTIATFVGEKMN